MYLGSENNRGRLYEMDRDEGYYQIGTGNFHENKSWHPPADYEEHVKNSGDTTSLDSEGKQKSFRRLLERFSDKTAMTGIPYINAAKLWYAKIIWVIILLIGIAGMTLHLYYLIDQYLEYDVQVSIRLGFSNLVFPAVTICNVNAVRKSQLFRTSQQLQSLVAQTDPALLKLPKRRRKRLVDEFNIDFDNFTIDFSPNKAEKDQISQIEKTFANLYMQENRNTRRLIGHQMNDMLVQCSYDGYRCFTPNFTFIQTEKYGNCYTIQSNTLKVANPGPDYGLSLIMYMETEEYLKGINQGYGARVLIHDVNTYPFPTEEGMFVSSAFETHIGLKKVEIVRESEPYGDCEDVNSYKEQYGATYTRTLCQVLCRQEKIMDRCECFDYSAFDILRTLNTSINGHPCDKNTERQCLAQITAEFENSPLDCPKCLNPCHEIQYVKSLSSRNWPTDEYANALMVGICEKIPEKCDKIRDYNNNGDIAGLTKNFVKIVVYFEDLNYELITEEPEIEVQQFSSDVGGAIGLWIGLSLISIFEVIQLMIECCAFGYHKCRHPKNKSSDRFKEKKPQQNKSKNKPSFQIPTNGQEVRKNGNGNSYSSWNKPI